MDGAGKAWQGRNESLARGETGSVAAGPRKTAGYDDGETRRTGAGKEQTASPLQRDGLPHLPDQRTWGPESYCSIKVTGTLRNREGGRLVPEDSHPDSVSFSPPSVRLDRRLTPSPRRCRPALRR